MKLPENEVHVWYFNVNDFAKQREYYKGLLSQEEISRSNRFKFEKDKILNIMARSALRILSGSYLGHDAKTIEFKYGAFGKPDYQFSTNLKFNVSHSGKFVALAFVINSEIGVDIEKIKTNFDVLKLAENFFSIREIAMLNKIVQDDLFNAFYRCWTRKESFIKAKGSGLSFPLASFTVSLNKNEEAELLQTEWNPQEKKEWIIFSFEPASGYIGSLSVAKEIQSVKYFDQEAFLTIHDSTMGLE